MFRSVQRAALLSSHLKARTPIDKFRGINILPRPPPKMSHLFEADTPDEVKNAKVRDIDGVCLIGGLNGVDGVYISRVFTSSR